MVDVAKKILLTILLSAACIFTFTGCRLQKINAEPAETEKQMDIVKLKQGDYDMNLLTELFLGMSSDKAKKYNIAKYDGYYQYQADGMELILAPVDERYLDEIQSVSFFDHNANAGPAYETIVYSTETQGTFTRYYQASLREYFPEENLETCSKEDAVSFCRPYAEALGYGDADVQVFALREQELRDASTYSGKWGTDLSGDGTTVYSGAPDPDAKLVYREVELGNRKQLSWEKKHEAFLLVYRPHVNGMLVDYNMQQINMVYVPAQDKIVYIKGFLLSAVEKIMEKKQIISSAQAVSTVMLANGIKEEDEMEDVSTEMVYSSDDNQLFEDKTIWPYWRVEFRKKKGPEPRLMQTFLVNAVTGQQFIYD